MPEGYYSSSLTVSSRVDAKVREYREDHDVSYKEAMLIVLAKDTRLARDYLNNDLALANFRGEI